jgi:hypothetical protein
VRITLAAQAKHMLRTAQAQPDQSLQQELVISNAFPTVTKKKTNKIPLPSVKI